MRQGQKSKRVRSDRSFRPVTGHRGGFRHIANGSLKSEVLQLLCDLTGAFRARAEGCLNRLLEELPEEDLHALRDRVKQK